MINNAFKYIKEVFNAEPSISAISQRNRDMMYIAAGMQVLYIKADKITDPVQNNYSLKLHGIDYNEIFLFLKKFFKHSKFEIDHDCQMTFIRDYNEITESVFVRINPSEKSVWLDFYAYEN